MHGGRISAHRNFVFDSVGLSHVRSPRKRRVTDGAPGGPPRMTGGTLAFNGTGAVLGDVRAINRVGGVDQGRKQRVDRQAEWRRSLRSRRRVAKR